MNRSRGLLFSFVGNATNGHRQRGCVCDPGELLYGIYGRKFDARTSLTRSQMIGMVLLSAGLKDDLFATMEESELLTPPWFEREKVRVIMGEDVAPVAPREVYASSRKK